MMKYLAACGMLALSTLAVATSPQVPVVKGPFESVTEAAAAARKCGFDELRMRIRRGETQLFVDGKLPPEDVLNCLWAWMTPRGRTMRFSPRWWKDDFTRDRP
jgi:hypothetical protein